MRELAFDEVAVVSGGGDAVCNVDDDGTITCFGDSATTTFGGDTFVNGDNGAYQISPDGTITFWPMP